jgi:VanZ family protein
MRAWLIRVWLWGPVVLQMAVIFAASSVPNLGALPGGLPDWFGHLVGYAMLGGLALRAFAGGRLAGVTGRTVVAAALVAVLYGVTDELHQTLVPGRAADTRDVAADAAGAALAVGSGWTWRRLSRRG